MNEEINEIEGRGIGYGHGLYWFHIKNKLIIWTYDQTIPPNIETKIKVVPTKHEAKLIPTAQIMYRNNHLIAIYTKAKR